MIPHITVGDLALFVIQPTTDNDYRIQLRLNFGDEIRPHYAGGYIEDSAWWKHPRFPKRISDQMYSQDEAEGACDEIAEFLRARFGATRYIPFS